MTPSLSHNAAGARTAPLPADPVSADPISTQSTGTVAAEGVRFHPFVARRGALVVVEACAPGSDIDLLIFDPCGGLVTLDLGGDDHPVCAFRAPADGAYRAVVRNNETRPVAYVFGCN